MQIDWSRLKSFKMNKSKMHDQWMVWSDYPSKWFQSCFKSKLILLHFSLIFFFLFCCFQDFCLWTNFCCYCLRRETFTSLFVLLHNCRVSARIHFCFYVFLFLFGRHSGNFIAHTSIHRHISIVKLYCFSFIWNLEKQFVGPFQLLVMRSMFNIHIYMFMSFLSMFKNN